MLGSAPREVPSLSKGPVALRQEQVATADRLLVDKVLQTRIIPNNLSGSSSVVCLERGRDVVGGKGTIRPDRIPKAVGKTTGTLRSSNVLSFFLSFFQRELVTKGHD